jgi:uncharacterized protein YoxC
MMPQAVYILWIIVLAVALILFPFIVRLLHKTFMAAKKIEQYLREMKEAGMGIAGNTGHILALDSTITVAVDILDSAGKINTNAETIETVMADRSAKFN